MKDLGAACALSEECLIGDCFRGVCRKACDDHTGCDWQMQGEICHRLSPTRGYCSLDRMECDAQRPCPDFLVCATEGRCRTPCSCEAVSELACAATSECPAWQECLGGRCTPMSSTSCLPRGVSGANVRSTCVGSDEACLEGACYELDERGIGGSNPGNIDECVAGTRRCGDQGGVVQVCNTLGQGWRLEETCTPERSCEPGCTVDAGPKQCPATRLTARCGCSTFCADEKTLKSTCPRATMPVIETCAPGSVCVQVGITGFQGSDAGCRPLASSRPLEPQVWVGGGDGGLFGIDRTEVSRGQYLTFLLAREAAGQVYDPLPGGCVAHALDPLRPAEWPWFDAPDRAASTSFCAAKAYCEWAGRRLCGPLGAPDAGLARAQLNDAGVDAWFAACTSGGRYAYAWGSTWDSSRCASADIFEVGDMPVGSMTSCQSPESDWAGVFDLSGNRAEWLDGELQGLGSSVTTGLAHGVIGGTPSVILRCDAFAEPNVDDDRYSFRCCSR
jgi:hypothetical protein